MGHATYWRRAECSRRTKPPRRSDGTLAVAPACIDIAEGLVEDYQLTVTGSKKGRGFQLRFAPRPDTDAAERARQHAQNCGRPGSRHERVVGHIERFDSPDRWADRPVRFADDNDLVGTVNVPSSDAKLKHVKTNYSITREAAQLPIYRAELEELLSTPSFLGACGLHELVESILISSDSAQGREEEARKRHAKLADRVMARKRHLVERRIIADKLVEEPIIERISSKGRSGRPVTSRSAKVTRKFLRSLADLDLDRWYNAIILTVAPPPRVDPIEFLRVADEFIRDNIMLSDGRGGIVDHPCEMFRATEPRHHPSAIKHLSDPEQLGLHDHTALVGWHYMRHEDRRRWGESVRLALLSHLAKKFGPLPYAEDGSRPCVHIRYVRDRSHFERWMHGQNGCAPYILKGIKGQIEIPIRRNWTAHRNPPPELPDYPPRLDEAEEGVAIVEGDRWAVKISGEAGLRFRELLCRCTGRRVPSLAISMEIYDADQRLVVDLLEQVGADCRLIHRAWRFVPT